MYTFTYIFFLLIYYIFRIVLKHCFIIFILQFLPLLLKTTTSIVVIPDQNIFFFMYLFMYHVYMPSFLCNCKHIVMIQAAGLSLQVIGKSPSGWWNRTFSHNWLFYSVQKHSFIFMILTNNSGETWHNGNTFRVYFCWLNRMSN